MKYRFLKQDTFKDYEKIDFAQYNGRIILWGAGKLGHLAAHLLKQIGIEIIAFCDNDKTKHGSNVYGHEIISPENLSESYPDSVVIITTIGRKDIIKQLDGLTDIEYYDAWPLFLEFDFAGFSEWDELYMTRMVNYYFTVIFNDYGIKKDFIADRLRLVVTSKCSLRCKECSNFVPYLESQRHADMETALEETLNIVEVIGNLNEVCLTGGEPFLHPNLDKLITGFKREKRINMITLVTNGTIMPNEKVFSAMKNEKRMHVICSNYGELSTKANELISLLKNNKVQCEEIVYKNWYKNSKIGYQQNTDAELRYKFNCCVTAGGLVLWDSKLFHCSTIPFLLEAGAFPSADDNFLDLSGLNSSDDASKKKIYDYINRANTNDYIDACKYCSGKSTSNFLNPVPVAEQAKGIIKVK